MDNHPLQVHKSPRPQEEKVTQIKVCTEKWTKVDTATTHKTPNKRLHYVQGAQSLLELTVPLLVKKIPVYYRNQRFVTMFTTACHVLLTLVRQIQSMLSHPI